MRINWVIASGYQFDPTVEIEKVKDIGAIWGSWTTWRSCQTDNVVCDNLSKAKELIARSFQNRCNFYVPNSLYQDLGRPPGLKLYDGKFQQELDYPEDVVSMHLAAAASDVVLLCGFDLGKPEVTADQYQNHKIRNRHGFIRGLIASDTQTQWVAIDHEKELDLAYQNLANLTCDKIENVLKYF